jgi:hypothetical protein
MKSSHRLTDQDLAQYADEHLAYELLMLVSTDAILRSITPVKHQHWLVYACNCTAVTSYALHSRNLIDFLYVRAMNGGRQTDVVIEEYIPSESLETHRPPITTALKDAKKKADKQAAHLTIDRITDYEGPKKLWQVPLITRDIMAVFRKLAPHFPANKTSPAFRQLVAHLNEYVPDVTIDWETASNSQIGFVLRAIRGGFSAWPEEITRRHFRQDAAV